MSVHVTSPIYKLNLDGVAKAILLVFGDHANPQGENSWPALETVAKEAGFSLATAKRYAKLFREDRVLVVTDNEGSGRRSVCYRIDLERAQALYGVLSKSAQDVPFCKPGHQLPGAKEKGRSDTFPGASKSVTGDRKGVTESKEKCHSDPQTIIEPKEPNAGAPPPPDRPGGPDGAAAPEPGAETASPAGPDPERELVSAHWRSKEPDLAARFGGDWAAVLKPLIVISDDGDTIELGAWTGIAARTAQCYAQDVARIVGRKIKIGVFQPKAAAAAPQAVKPAPACAHWQAHQGEMAAHLGDASWASWFEELIVLSDDGATIRLGAKSQFWTDHCQKLAAGLEVILGRKLQVVHFDPAAEALARRLAKQEAERAEARKQALKQASKEARSR